MSPNVKEALVFFLPMILVFGAFIIGFFVFIMSGRSKENKARYEHGKQMGALTARDIGCEKAYKIADELPECAYRDGYVEGIAEVERDAWKSS